MSTQTVKKRFPIGFYFCATTFSFERAAYYSAKFLIYIFLTTAIVNGGLGIDKGQAAIMQANLVAFTYLAPIFGGYISDRWIGARYTVPVGMFIMGAGYYVGSIASSVSMVNIMIILVSIGTAFFKGNVSAVNGQLFDDQDQLDAAFSIQYSFVNIGSFIGTTAVGILYLKTFAKAGVLGFSQCFFIAAVLCVIGGLWFILGWRFLGDAGKRPFKEGIVAEKVEDAPSDAPLTGMEKKRIWAIILVSIFSVIFWLFWYLTYLAVYDYGAEFVNMFVGGFEVPLAWFDSLNALVCIVLGPVLAALWIKLSKRPQGDMSLFRKTGLGLIFLGLAFLMLVGAEITRGIGAAATAKASIVWIIFFGILLSCGEMLFSPLGNSFVSKFAPKKYLGVLMGVWTFATFLAGLGYGYIYKFTLNFDMIKVYTVIPIILFIAAALLFVFDKSLSKLVVDDEN
ncbi:peptide MFS transporter [Metaclostridioides mangenotii]|jgi:POT family proton-dependent oligopeptide transporter|uniref:Dipeptide/tripeptide permease n=1 Tax=Metaclostridioides mangenotii TaxID=1540 RepID=A0ABS4EB54_9FIRM|nr:peptide MFS transporter [Clostridioides mangenotii]MBP1855159.1 dipeptide/tripeptide permease [Clostridioides mangenotii]